MKRLYHAYDVDEETPVQYVGVYVTRWRPEWGEPSIMFAEIDWDKQALYDATPALLEAAKRMMSIPKRADDDTTEWDSACAEMWAAIAQAEGEQ